MQFRIGVRSAQVALVPEQKYPVVLSELIDQSRHRLLCSVFIVDLSPRRDRELEVDDTLHSMSGAVWRGVDVRLLIGGSRTNLELIELADAGRQRAISLDIPCRWLTASRRRGSHSKFVVADDSVLCGSHNWSPSAFRDSVQDSILVRSADLAAYLAAVFEKQWLRARIGETRVPV